ncbi:ABC transporter permease [Paracoccus spongiarum]|uniref:Transport permease protein n=1 Tax=Paracoccus spongiarum TaxID=3064387 RepID=A0ABT9J7A9_9RHOB|nr:ABC transporter permease [Paracoccus sp. 2205BS29-5]MDP5305695.1 ABC transporter permease [Paracoccus sp. 2205BS29-5]
MSRNPAPSIPSRAAPGTAGTPAATPRLRPVHRQRSFASLRAISALVLREMATSYGRSPGGYFWAIAEPVGGIVLLTAIFSLGFRSPPMGTNFAIFYATGVVPFFAFMSLSTKVAQSIRQSRQLLAYPAVTFMDAILAKVFFNVVTQLLVGYLVLSIIVLTQETRTDPQVLQIALAYAMAFTLAIGVGTVNCFLFTAFPWWQQVWSIVTRPLFLLSCIFFIFDDIPDAFQPYLWFNPLVHVVGQMRSAFYPAYRGDYVTPVYVFAVGLVLMAIGLLLLNRYHRDLLNS